MRQETIERFLQSCGWNDAVRAPLAGDASFRRYERLTRGAEHAVLMDAPPEKEDVRPFLHVAGLLEAQSLSAPRILGHDATHGLVLLEDLGDGLYSRLLALAPEREPLYYEKAAELLLQLLRARDAMPLERLPAYDEALYLREAELFSEWFLPQCSPLDAKKRQAEYREIWRGVLAKLPTHPATLVLRDYHADNLLWLPERMGTQSVGLLDFQDAVRGSPAYDLASLLEDARRDVTPATVTQVLRYYIREGGFEEASFMTSYALLAAQRNCKIIGIFARLALRDGKPHYLSFLPRVWGHLQRDLAHEALAPLRDWMERQVPARWRGALLLHHGQLQVA